MRKDPRLQPYLLCLFSYFVLGCMILTVNTINSPVITEYAWKDSQGGLLITFMSLGNLAMSIAGNMLMDRIGRNRAMMLYIAMACLGLGGMACLHQPEPYYCLMLMVGFAWGGINTLVNTVPTELYDGSSSRLNLMHACYAIGAVLFPLIVGFLLQKGYSWRVPVWIVMGLFAVQMVLSLLIRMPASQAAQADKQDAPKLAYRREVPFYLSVLTFFVYVGVESSVSTWLSPYLAQENPMFAEVPSQTMVSLMWLMLLAGRLVFSLVGRKVSSRLLLIILSAAFLLGVGGLVLFGKIPAAAIAFVAMTGLGMTAIYGLAVSVAARYVKGSVAAAGIMFGAGGMGSAVIPYVSGLVSDRLGLRAAMAVLCFFLFVLLVVSIFNLRSWKSVPTK